MSRSLKMVAKTLKCDNHSITLVSAVADLYDKPGQYQDVEIKVGTTIFLCHKLILSLNSSYFQRRLFPSGSRSNVNQISLEAAAPSDFKQVLQFMYRGEIQLETGTVAGVHRVAKMTDMVELRQTCVQFMKDTLDVGTCVPYWKEDAKDSELGHSCLELFVKKFVAVTKASNLKDITQEMMEAAIERDDLNVSSEVEVCDCLMTWLDAINQNSRSIQLFQLLSRVRWSGIKVEYIKSKMIHNDAPIKDQQSVQYLSRIISYGLSGIQFPGLRTRHRPSTELDTCLVIFGFNNGDKVTRDSCRVSLHDKAKISDIVNFPTHVNHCMVACSVGSTAYVTGLGATLNETWRWDAIGGWARCADLIQRRQRHCATFVDSSSMFVLGGYVLSTSITLSSVEHFDSRKNKWTTVGNLSHGVQCAGCATYKTSVYVFGGFHQDKPSNKIIEIDLIQEYDTTTHQCTVLTQRLPQSLSILQAVLWDKSVILINNWTCLIFDLVLKTVQERDQFAVGVNHFGLVLDDQLLFVVGGGKGQEDSNGKVTWTCTDEINSIPVMDIINNEVTVNWCQHAKLKSPSLVQTYSLMTLT